MYDGPFHVSACALQLLQLPTFPTVAKWSPISTTGELLYKWLHKNWPEKSAQNLHRIHKKGVQNLQVMHPEFSGFLWRRVLTTLDDTFSFLYLLNQ